MRRLEGIAAVALVGIGLAGCGARHPDTADGLAALVGELAEAVRTQDSERVDELLEAVALEEPKEWCRERFAGAAAKQAARAYRNRLRGPQGPQALLASLAGQGELSVSAERFDHAGDTGLTLRQRRVLEAMREPIPIYSARVSVGDGEQLHLHSFVYDRGFRYLGDLRMPGDAKAEPMLSALDGLRVRDAQRYLDAEDVVEQLLADLAGADADLREQAGRALAAAGAAAAGPLLLAAASGDESRRDAALPVLEELGESALPRLIRFLGHDDPKAVSLASRLISARGETAVPALLTALESERSLLAASAILDGVLDKPLVAYSTEQISYGRSSLVRKLRAALGDRVQLFECKAGKELCRRLTRQIELISVTRDNGTCYDKFYFQGPCRDGLKGVTVRVRASYWKERRSLGSRTLATASTPSTIQYSYRNVDMGPQSGDVSGATAEAVAAKVKGVSFEGEPLLAALLKG